MSGGCWLRKLTEMSIPSPNLFLKLWYWLLQLKKLETLFHFFKQSMENAILEYYKCKTNNHLQSLTDTKNI